MATINKGRDIALSEKILDRGCLQARLSHDARNTCKITSQILCELNSINPDIVVFCVGFNHF